MESLYLCEVNLLDYCTHTSDYHAAHCIELAKNVSTEKKKPEYIGIGNMFQNPERKDHTLSALQRINISLTPIFAEEKNKMFHAIESKHIQMLFLITIVFRIADLEGIVQIAYPSEISLLFFYVKS